MNNVGGTGYRAFTGNDSFTNWDAALQTARTAFDAADAVIFITDGNPNRSIGNTYDDNVAGWNAATTAALGNADALKAKTLGTVYGIGAGSAFTSTPTAGDPVTPAGRLAQVVDVNSVTSFADLDEALPGLIASICAPSIDVQKTTNGEQADSAPGPTIPAGNPVNWEYTVTNTGQLTVYNVTVTDDNNDGATITCPGGNGALSLDPGASVTCSASSISWYANNHQQHANTVTAVGTPLNKPSVNDTDPSHYEPTLVCPWTANDGIVIDIFGNDPTGNGGFMLGAPNQTPNQVGPINGLNIPAGSYNVLWASYDHHIVFDETNPGQTQEIWYLDFAGTTSGITNDVPWNSDFAQGTLDTVLTLDSDQSSVMIRHGGPPNVIGSVYAICAVLDPIDPANIGITKTLTTQSDLYDGDIATFDVTIENSSDDEILTVTSLTENIGGSDIDLLAVPDADGLEMNTCNNNLPITVAPNGSAGCTFSIIVSSGMTSASDDRCDPEGKIDVVTGAGIGDMTGAQSSDDDCADITINPDPTLEVNKSVANPGIFYDGDEVTYDVEITNNSDTESITIDSLTENIGGDDIDLLAPGLAVGLQSNTCNDSTPIVIGAGDSVGCSFSILVSPDMTTATDDNCPNPDAKVDVVEATGTGDDSGKAVSDDDCADITVNPDPDLTVDKTVVTDGDIHDGDEVTYQVVITNGSDTESVTIDTLTENIGGADIDLLANPAAPGLESNTCNANPSISIAAGGDFTCEFSIIATSDMTSATDASCPNGGKVDIVEASGIGDSSGKDVSDDDCAEITVDPEPGGSLTIQKLVYDPTTGEYVEQAFLPSNTTFPATITWQITVENPSEWVVENLFLTDPNAASCVTEFAAALEMIAPGKTSLDPLESVTFTCEGSIAGVPAANTATAGGTDTWGRPVPEVTDSATVGQVLASGTIGDTVWYDTNANGVQDGTEAGIAGVPVKLVGNDGQDVDPVTAGIQTTLTLSTNASGKYLFSGLPAGSYTVSVALSSVPNTSTTPLRFTTPSSYTIALPDGGSVLTADFGVVADTLPVTGINTDSIVLVAMLLLVIGALAVLATRRKEDGSAS
jgi:LPXTG-motif cell wall-anchored protein